MDENRCKDLVRQSGAQGPQGSKSKEKKEISAREGSRGCRGDGLGGTRCGDGCSISEVRKGGAKKYEMCGLRGLQRYAS